jgi:hypothetical protein
MREAGPGVPVDQLTAGDDLSSSGVVDGNVVGVDGEGELGEDLQDGGVAGDMHSLRRWWPTVPGFTRWSTRAAIARTVSPLRGMSSAASDGGPESHGLEGVAVDQPDGPGGP